MKNLLVLMLCICVIIVSVNPVLARDKFKRKLVPVEFSSDNSSLESADPALRALLETAAVDSYCIVWYDFEPKSWQGWTRIDYTERDTFFHVDDFYALGGGDFGRLVPIEGAKSMWCGTRTSSNDPYICHWKEAPGYGTNWDQILTTNAMSFSGAITLQYNIVWDSEEGFDITEVQYDAGSNDWQTLASYTGVGETGAQHVIIGTQARTKLRFHFTSDIGWDDEDGGNNTDGACIIDNIRVADGGGFVNLETFESAAVGATDVGIWHARPAPPFGLYSGLKNSLTDRDPCGDNFGTQVVFFIGSPNPSTSYPGLYDTPFCTGAGGTSYPCQDEAIVSPVLDLTKYSTNKSSVQNGTIPPGDLQQLGGAQLRFTAYRDLPLENLVFFSWAIRRVYGDGCPGPWLDAAGNENGGYVYYGPYTDYQYATYDVSIVAGANEPVQIRMGCVDLCKWWYLTYGDCAQHTPSPYIDNVGLYRYRTTGPRWTPPVSNAFFEDNFPENESDIESYVRTEAGGDASSVVCVSLLGGGIAADPTFGGPAVYLHVKATYIGPPPLKPPLVGPSLAGSTAPGIVFNYVGDDGTWTTIQCDSNRWDDGSLNGADNYMVDLNDELFTRGYQIEYYFSARDNAGVVTTLPEWAGRLHTGPYYEFTCLPTLNSDILLVAHFPKFPADVTTQYWQTALDAVLSPPANKVDQYHVRWTTGLSQDVTSAQLAQSYNNIIWHGGLYEVQPAWDPSIFISDCQMLLDWLTLSDHPCGLWICGDNAASESGSAARMELQGSWCGIDLANTSYFEATGGASAGGVVSPLISGVAAAGIFIHAGLPDRFYAYGGCPIINSFDVLQTAGSGLGALAYPQHGGTNYLAAVANTRTNPAGYAVRTMWFGFDFPLIRDDAAGAPIDRFHVADDALSWLQAGTNIDVTPADIPRAYTLAQNYPNPFNPSTTIRYDMKDRGLVSIRIYNVAGQLVRTLVNGEKEAGIHSVAWDGRNGAGAGVASGIYFYKMETAGFSATKKLVMIR